MKGENTYLLLSLFLVTSALFLLLFLKRRKKPVPAAAPGTAKVYTDDAGTAADVQAGRYTRDDVLLWIRELGLPDSITRLVLGDCQDVVLQRHRLDKDYACPYSITDLWKQEQAVYDTDRYKPILAYADATIFAYDTIGQGFVSYDIETGYEPWGYCLTWDGVFVSEILRWWEYEIPDEDILYIGNYLGLKHTALALESIYSTTQGKGFADHKQLDQWEEEMLVKIDGKRQVSL